MRISERLGKIVDTVRIARADMRRLAVDLPEGTTLEILDSVEARAGYILALLSEEAHELRRRND